MKCHVNTLRYTIFSSLVLVQSCMVYRRNITTFSSLVLVQSCMDNNADVAPQASEEIQPRRVKIKVRRHRQRAVACKSPFVQLCVSKYKRLTEEETHVADYVFDESKDLRLVTNHMFSKYCS